jgi:signal transduction histidine kinase
MTTQATTRTGADGHGAGVDTRSSDAEELELFRVLTLVMSEGSDTESSLRGALETICSRTQWSYGELWLRHAQTGAFHLSPVWHGAGTPAEVERYRVFHEASWLRGNTPENEGLRAQVRATRQAVWISSVDDLPARGAAARAAGLEAALAVPAMSGGEIEAVAVFLVSAVRPEDQRLMGLVAAAARPLGSLLARRRLEERALRVQRLHRLTAEMSRVLFRSRNRQDILGEACRLAVEADDLATAWIGEVDDEANEVRPVALAGAAMDDIEGLPVIVESEAMGTGPGRLAARLRTASVCNDVRLDTRVAPWRQGLLGRGLLSAASLPIRHRGETFFVVNFYSTIADFFDADEMAVLEGLASEIGFGLDHLASEVARAAAEKRMEARTAELLASNHELEARTAELLASNDELESFAYSASHDMRTPLRAINGFSEVLLGEHAQQLDAEGRRYLSRISSAALRMGEVIDSLLTLSRLTRTELREDDVDLGIIARDLVEDLRISSPLRVVDVTVADSLPARGDPRLLRLLLQNLLDNAWKFTSRREVAHIAVGRTVTARGPAFYVRDDGVGFEVTGVSRPFRPFQRLHAAPGLDGLGMGLATVQRVLRLHRGAVWADSKPDGGATFYFQIGPVDAAVPAAPDCTGGQDVLAPF